MAILEINGMDQASTRLNEAEKRLKKLERDYQHSYEKYIQTRSNWYRFYIKAKHSNYHSGQAGYCIRYYQDLQERLQNNLEKLNRVEEKQREIERSLVHCKEFSKLHGCKSLTKENKILQKIEERQEHVETNDKIKRTNLYRRGNWQFNYYRSKIPKSSSSKSIHKLLRQVKDPEKSRDYNPTSQDGLTSTRIEIDIKVLTKVIKKIKKEEKGMESRVDYEYEEKIRELKKKCEWICGKWDEENKNIVGFKKAQDVFVSL